MMFLIGSVLICLIDSYTPAPGGPFSALTPSMWPQDILAKYYQVHCFFYLRHCG